MKNAKFCHECGTKLIIEKPLGTKENPMPLKLRKGKLKPKKIDPKYQEERERKLRSGKLFESTCPNCGKVTDFTEHVAPKRLCRSCFEDSIMTQRQYPKIKKSTSNTICNSCGMPLNKSYGICGCSS